MLYFTERILRLLSTSLSHSLSLSLSLSPNYSTYICTCLPMTDHLRQPAGLLWQ